MSKFVASGGNFWLDGQPQLIQAGEFHYFRTPQDQWAHRLGLLKSAGFNAVASYIPWLWHQLDEDVSDFDGHSHPLRNLAGFLDLAAELGLYIIPRPGPYIMAETINEGIPHWIFNKYPQVAFVNQQGVAQNIVSYLHPDFLSCVVKWYQAVFSILVPRQINHSGKIIMIQLDNEMGMMPWVRNIIDTNPDTIARFVNYLHFTYGDHLSSRYPNGDLAEFLLEGILNPKEPYASKIVDDYRRFYRKYLLEYASFLVSEAKACGMEVLPVINIHGFANEGKTFPIGLSQLVDVMGMQGVISATDVYPRYIGEGNFHQLLLINEMTKSLQNKQQALFSIEFQAGGNQDFSNGQSSFFDLHTRLCISSGMRAINHYLFFDGENDPLLSPVKRHDWGHPVRKDGSLRKHYYRYPKLSKALSSYGTDLVLARPQTVTTIGYLIDYFMTEVNNSFTQKPTSIITHQRDDILFDLLARGLALTHRPFNAIDLNRCALDVRHIPLCWVMLDKQCDAGTQQKLVEYVESGGKLIIAGRMCIEDFNHQACTILKDAVGIRAITSDAPFVSNLISVFQYCDVPVSFLETYSGKFDEVFARSKDGKIVGFIQSLGNGQITMFGASMTANTLDDLDVVHQMGMLMGCPPLFKLSNWADVRISRGENYNFLFINNYQDDPLETTIEYDSKLLFGGNALYVPARRGLILPLDWQLNKNVAIHYATSEIVEIIDDGSTIVLKLDPPEFHAALSIAGYQCDQCEGHAEHGQALCVHIHSNEGIIVLRAVA